MSYGTIYNILHDDLGLEKLSARWVPKLLSQEQKQARVETSMAFNKMVQMKGLVGGAGQDSHHGRVLCVLPHPYH